MSLVASAVLPSSLPSGSGCTTATAAAIGTTATTAATASAVADSSASSAVAECSPGMFSCSSISRASSPVLRCCYLETPQTLPSCL